MKYIKLNERLLSTFINEGLRDAKQYLAKNIDNNNIDDILNSLKPLDPTGSKNKWKYIYFITDAYVKFNNEFNEETLKNYIEKYDELATKNKFTKVKGYEKYNDIMFLRKKIKSLQDFYNIINKVEKESNVNDFNVMESEYGEYIDNYQCPLIAENEDWFVVEPRDSEYMTFFGKGTKWCITEPGTFEDYYNDNGLQFYVCVRKNNNRDKNTQKIAIVIPNPDYQKIYSETQYFDVKDNAHEFNNNVAKSLNLPDYNKIDYEEYTRDDFEFKPYREAIEEIFYIQNDKTNVNGNRKEVEVEFDENNNELYIGGDTYISNETSNDRILEILEESGASVLFDKGFSDTYNIDGDDYGTVTLNSFLIDLNAYYDAYFSGDVSIANDVDISILNKSLSKDYIYSLSLYDCVGELDLSDTNYLQYLYINNFKGTIPYITEIINLNITSCNIHDIFNDDTEISKNNPYIEQLYIENSRILHFLPFKDCDLNDINLYIDDNDYNEGEIISLEGLSSYNELNISIPEGKEHLILNESNADYCEEHDLNFTLNSEEYDSMKIKDFIQN